MDRGRERRADELLGCGHCGYRGGMAVRVVADAFYAKAPFFNGLLARGIHVISRLRKDAVGWAAPELPPPGKRGRKPRYGRQWRLASLLTAQTPTRDRLTLYGKL